MNDKVNNEFKKLQHDVGASLFSIFRKQHLPIINDSYYGVKIGLKAKGRPKKKNISLAFTGTYASECSNIIFDKLGKKSHINLTHPPETGSSWHVLKGLRKNDFDTLGINNFAPLWKHLYLKQNRNPNVIIKKKSVANSWDVVIRIIAHIIGGIVIGSTAAILSISVAAAAGATISGTVAAKIGLTTLTAALAANPITAIAIASVAGVALVGILGFTIYKCYQANSSIKDNKIITCSSTDTYTIRDAAQNYDAPDDSKVTVLRT